MSHPKIKLLKKLKKYFASTSKGFFSQNQRCIALDNIFFQMSNTVRLNFFALRLCFVSLKMRLLIGNYSSFS